MLVWPLGMLYAPLSDMAIASIMHAGLGYITRFRLSNQFLGYRGCSS